MLNRISGLLGNFFRKTKTIDNEPLNKVSLIVLILIDIFIIVNVFSGLEDISRWHLSPAETYPCYQEWKSYEAQSYPDKDYRIINDTANQKKYSVRNFKQEYQNKANNRLGTVSDICLDYAELKDNLRNTETQNIIESISNNSETQRKLEQANRKIRAEYDSTLLETIAGQPSENSINSIPAQKAKQKMAQNNNQIANVKEAIASLKQQLLAKSDSQKFIAFLNNQERFNLIKEKFDQASFWYPSTQLGFQSLFLLPLIAIATLIHQLAQRKRYGLVALISWHLLVIFCIPLIIKLFQFLQIGSVLEAISRFLKVIFLNLLFLVHYVYILLVPLIGYGIIRLFQRIVFNTKVQAANRVQKSRCVKCAKKVRYVDSYCPHCGEYQYQECSNCHEFTYKYLPFCNQCGHTQEL